MPECVHEFAVLPEFEFKRPCRYCKKCLATITEIELKKKIKAQHDELTKVYTDLSTTRERALRFSREAASLEAEFTSATQKIERLLGGNIVPKT